MVRFLKRITLLIALVVSSIILIVLRYYLFFMTETFARDFTRQNVSEIAAGDIYALTQRLNSVSASVPLTCLKATKNDVPFYRFAPGHCGSSVIHSTAVIDRRTQGGIVLEVTFKLPSELVLVGTLSLFSHLGLLGILIVVTRRHERKLGLRDIEIARLEGELNRSIVETTQALAHDVRKPFSLLKMGLRALSGEDDPRELKELAGVLSEEVSASINSVNAMLNDIMMAGSSQPPSKEQVDLAELVAFVLSELTRDDLNSEITVSKTFQHSWDVNVNENQFKRVLQNIVDNAVQAMGRRGSIWINSVDKLIGRTRFVSIVIGNSDSYISPESISEIFKPYFTEGKKDGTGLGLAIVRKIILAHGGEIYCRSHRVTGTEFEILIPA